MVATDRASERLSDEQHCLVRVSVVADEVVPLETKLAQPALGPADEAANHLKDKRVEGASAGRLDAANLVGSAARRENPHRTRHNRLGACDS